MSKLIHYIICCFDFCSKPGPAKYHLHEDQLITIYTRLCPFMMHEFISAKCRYRPDNGHMTDNAALFDWAGESQDKLHIVHDLFKHYLGV
jgi:hypothetical protein